MKVPGQQFRPEEAAQDAGRAIDHLVDKARLGKTGLPVNTAGDALTYMNSMNAIIGDPKAFKLIGPEIVTRTLLDASSAFAERVKQELGITGINYKDMDPEMARKYVKMCIFEVPELGPLLRRPNPPTRSDFYPELPGVDEARKRRIHLQSDLFLGNVQVLTPQLLAKAHFETTLPGNPKPLRDAISAALQRSMPILAGLR